MLDERADLSYPDVAQDEEGNLFIIYDYARYKAKQLILTKISEEEIRNGRVEKKGSFLRRVIDQAGEPEDE